MRRHAAGVTIVTLTDGRECAGLTVSSFTSISLEPPIVMVSINSTGSNERVVQGATAFAVHLLGIEHEELSSRFAGSEPWAEKSAGLAIRSEDDRAPVIDSIPTIIEAAVMESHQVGTHTVLFGGVTGVALKAPSSKGPLLYFDRTYRRIE